MSDGSGAQIVTQVVDGQSMQGWLDSAGGFRALDGKWYVPDGGPAQQGISDPAGNFIKNGEIRYNNGTPEYGSVQNSIFYNETNTLAQLPNGRWVNGTLVNNTFVSSDVVNGQTMPGSYDGNSAFRSLDGKWYVPDGGPAQQGISDPAGNFIKNGEIRYNNGTPEYGSVQNSIFYNETNTLAQLPNGRWVSGTVVNNTFVATYEYQGQTLEGYYDPTTGDFFLKSGLGEIPATGANAGKLVPGLTDPATGNFIPGGVVQTIEGVQYTGSVQNGIFYAASGTLALILSIGLVVHGVTQNNTFVATYEYQGQTLHGSYDDKGNFFTQDGLGEIPATGSDAGKLVPGVTDPATGFIPGGVTKTMPDGTVLYGNMDGSDFYTGTKIVFSNGTVVTGTLDPKTGIFKASSGSYYFVGQNGIVSALLNSDGSYKLPDGSAVMTAQAWEVDLPVFLDTINFVETYGFLITMATADILGQFSAIESAWGTPAGASFSFVAEMVKTGIDRLNTMLTDMVQRMKTSYQNYLTTEQQAVQNVSA